ncbi:two component transcriptional regulator, LytTR family [Flagellimonas taeanensis]|uniref:Two component transcriptional regulator, LytTR family n=1 Tax=Flagellimonas taeanensis TaxID=1005926 RepID=A0A1M6TFE0_9FLAO|nr:LytTR family DNA-binding domain-containing protein [Allomuricauda taeanensis]MEE1962174.1 LytTR family DNA-binding domain-containing protein [Allomuricauda taeanensis]SFB87888.1 two component transcriptional regulator, LytTR family [Allomuricauda taeanensis]SHK55599.1 two component transcriptional regulator, LytTR family [Allomuricauda taeanensis]
MSINVAIIEDEPAIARNLEFTLKELDPSLTVLHQMDSVKSAVAWLGKNIQHCHLLFMDIRLIDGLSFDIFQTIKPSAPIIFITAYDHYALEAFKVNGLDYILKPFQKEEVATALDKYKNTRGAVSINSNTLTELLQHLQSNGNRSFREAYLVHYQNKLIPLPVDKIHWFHTEQEVMYAHTDDGKKYVIDSTLDRVGAEISPKLFFRANRQFIVQRRAVKHLDFYFNGRLIVNVEPKPREKIIVSKAKAPEFKKWLDE